MTLKRKSLLKRKKGIKRTQRKRNTGQSALWREYGLKKPPNPRYKGRKGILWYCISRYIRKSEWLEHGECVDGCGTKIPDWRLADCGHYIAASRGFCTLFERKNLGLQTKKCNNPTWTPDASVGFGLTIDKRYGKGTAESLFKESKKICKEYSQKEYDKYIWEYIKLFEELEDKQVIEKKIEKKEDKNE